MISRIIVLSIAAFAIAGCASPKNCRKVSNTPLASTTEKVIVDGKERTQVKETWAYKCD